MLGEFFCEGSPPDGYGVDGIVNGNLAVFMVQPRVDIFAAALEDLLTQHDRSWRRIWEKVIFRNLSPGDGCPAVIAEVEDACLDAQPGTVRECVVREGNNKGD